MTKQITVLKEQRLPLPAQDHASIEAENKRSPNINETLTADELLFFMPLAGAARYANNSPYRTTLMTTLHKAIKCDWGQDE